MLKWSVPVDDEYHRVGDGPVVLVACQVSPKEVQVWTIEEGDPPSIGFRLARVYGTGHDVADEEHLGSCPAGPAVWHVFAAKVP